MRLRRQALAAWLIETICGKQAVDKDQGKNLGYKSFQGTGSKNEDRRTTIEIINEDHRIRSLFAPSNPVKEL